MREEVVKAIPYTLKLAVTAGIIVKNNATLVSMGNFTTAPVVIASIGIIVIVALSKKNVRGPLLIGILVSTIIAWIYALKDPKLAADTYKIFLPDGVFKFESFRDIAFKLDFSYITDPNKVWTFITIMLTFLFVDFFDTVGTLVGAASKVGLINKDGEVKNAGKALLVDAIATTLCYCSCLNNCRILYDRKCYENRFYRFH